MVQIVFVLLSNGVSHWVFFCSFLVDWSSQSSWGMSSWSMIIIILDYHDHNQCQLLITIILKKYCFCQFNISIIIITMITIVNHYRCHHQQDFKEVTALRRSFASCCLIGRGLAFLAQRILIILNHHIVLIIIIFIAITIIMIIITMIIIIIMLDVG